MSLGKIWVIASNVFREIIRDRILYLIFLFAILFVAVNVLVPEVAATTEQKIIPDVGLAAISVLSLLVTAFIGAGLINKELEKRTILVLAAKPISRAEFVLGKYLGLVAVLAVLVAAMTAIYLALLTFNRIPYPLVSTLIAIGFLLLELCLLGAAAVLFGVFTSSLLAILLTFAVYFMGHLSRDIVTLGNLAENPTIQRLTRGMYLILPDLSRLDFKNQAVYGLELMPQPLELLGSFGYGLLYTVLLLTLAIAIFARRQF